jgi:PadR family transcriptional regulator PadR
MEVTANVLIIGHALLGVDDRRRYGYELMAITWLPSSSMYPVLRRMEEAGWVTSYFEPWTGPLGRPRRRYYEMTDEGDATLRARIERFMRFFKRDVA